MDAYDMALVKTRCRDCTSFIPAVRTFDREVVRKAGCLRGGGFEEWERPEDVPEKGCAGFGKWADDVERPWETRPNLSVDMEYRGGQPHCGFCGRPVAKHFRFCPDCGCEMEDPRGGSR